MTTRVALVHEVVSPYREPLFTALAHQPELELTVVLCGEKDARRSWTVNLDRLPYPWVMARSKAFVVGRVEKWTWFVPHNLPATLDKLRPDVVVVGGYASLPAAVSLHWAQKRKVPAVMWSESIRHHRGGFIRSLKHAMVSRATTYVVPGELARHHLVSLGAPSSQIFRSPNCVDLNRFRPGDSTPRLVRTLLLCGRLVPKKGWHLFVDALAEADAARRTNVLVVGEGPGRVHLEHRFAAHRIRAMFTGHLEYERLPEVFQRADAVVFPTLDDVWGFSLQEAMACGLPAISSIRAGATAELVEDGKNGWVVEPDVPSIARGVNNLLALTPSGWAAMSEAARAAAESLSLDNAVRGFERAIRSADAT